MRLTPAPAARVPAPALARSRARPARSKPRHPPGAPRAGRHSLETIPVLPSTDHEADQGADVERIELPFRIQLEQAFGRPLDRLVVMTGDPIAEWLSQAQAEAATVGGVIWLPDPVASLETVAHEVVHALQAAGTAPAGPDSIVPQTVSPQDPAETEASARSHDLSAVPIRESVPADAVALRRAGIPAAPAPTKPTPKDEFARELDKTQAPAELKLAGRAKEEPRPAMSPDSETVPPKAAPAEGVAEKAPAPELELPGLPETELSPEEQAARQAELEAAKTAIEQADDVEGVVGAYADAPPTVKAATQSMVDGRIHEVIASDQQKFDANVPDFHATMKGGEAPPTAGAVTAPEPSPLVLEAEVPPPAPEPHLPHPPPPKRYRENDEIVSLILRMFGLGAARAIARALGTTVTNDPGVDTWPGEKPKVLLKDETDPARLGVQKRNGLQQAREERAKATQAVIDGRGPEEVQLREMDELVAVGELEAPQVDELAGSPEAEKLNQMAMPEEVLAQFDQDMGATMQASLEEARGQLGQAEADRDQQRDAALTTAERDRDRLTREADDKQRSEVLKARESIQTERQVAIDGQEAAVAKLETDAELARAASQGEIEKRVRADEEEISKRYDKAEADAKAKVAEGERKAEAERLKKEKEAENDSWWDRAVSFVGDMFDALTSFINDLFDGIRSLVNGLIDAVVDFAKGLIDKVAGFIKGAISLFGDALKGLIDITVGQVFPELAADLNAGIDSAVSTVNKAVDDVANTLKAGIDAVADILKKAVNAVIGVFQAAVNVGLALMESAITGNWDKVARRLLESVLKLLGIDPADFYAFIAKIADTVDLILDDPLAFLGHLVDAVVLGFQKFSDHFLTHLKAGIVAWLTGTLGNIQMPKEFDLPGLLDVARQVLGLTWDWLREKAERLIGKENVARLEFLLSYVQTLREGGFPALWARLTQDLSGLVDMVVGGIKDYLVENITLGIIKFIATLFTPVGALVRLVFTIWKLYTFVRDQLRRIVQIVRTIVDGLANIARGIIEDAGLRVETALANLLPLAIDLIARLLDLGGVAAKAREIIAGIHDWIDQAVNKLLDRVLKAFTGKGEPAVAEAAPAEAIGERLTVDVAEGPDHVLTIAASGTDATAMLASDALPVSRWLDNFAAKVPELEQEAEQKDATEKIGAARTKLAELDPEADALLAAQAGGGEPSPKSEAEVRKDEEALRDALVAVFDAFGGKGPAILSLFAAEIQAAHEDAKLQLRKALRENETTFQTMKWAEVRKAIADAYNPFQSPILKEHVFGRKAREAAAAMIPTEAALTSDQKENFLSDWLARRVNSGEGPEFAAARTALQTILFENGSLSTSGDLKAAVAEALKLFQGSGDKPDPELVAEVSGQIIPFLLAVARGDATFKKLDLSKWESEYWGKPANQQWIKERFRGSGGHHEWIPTNYVGRVIERARTSADDDDLETAARWVTFQDELRSPTDILLYPPEGRYMRNAPWPRDPVSHERESGGALTVLQGHVGAVYAPVGENAYREDVVAQTAAQGPWHDDLRKIFDRNPGTDLATMERIVQEIETFIDDHLWFGTKALPSPGFNEYYAAARDKAAGDGLLTFGALQKIAAGAAEAIDNDFTRARKAVGL